MRWIGSRPRIALTAGLAVVWVSSWLPQAGAQGGSLLERFTQMSVQAEANGLAEPFKGVTADGTVRSRGCSRSDRPASPPRPVRTAADTFLRALSDGAAHKTTFAVDDAEWRKWMNQHFYVRQGVSFKEMSEPQREAAFALLGAG